MPSSLLSFQTDWIDVIRDVKTKRQVNKSPAKQTYSIITHNTEEKTSIDRSIVKFSRNSRSQRRKYCSPFWPNERCSLFFWHSLEKWNCFGWLSRCVEVFFFFSFCIFSKKHLVTLFTHTVYYSAYTPILSVAQCGEAVLDALPCVSDWLLHVN